MPRFKVFHYFWITSAIIFIIGLFTYSDVRAVINFNIHDTYFVIHVFHLTTLISLLYFLLGISYWAFHKYQVKLIKPLIQIHTMASIGGFLLYIMAMFIFEDDTQTSQSDSFNSTSNLELIITTLFFIIIVSQVLFILNLIISAIKHSIQQVKSKL